MSFFFLFLNVRNALTKKKKKKKLGIPKEQWITSGLSKKWKKIMFKGEKKSGKEFSRTKTRKVSKHSECTSHCVQESND